MKLLVGYYIISYMCMVVQIITAIPRPGYGAKRKFGCWWKLFWSYALADFSCIVSFIFGTLFGAAGLLVSITYFDWERYNS